MFRKKPVPIFLPIEQGRNAVNAVNGFNKRIAVSWQQFPGPGAHRDSHEVCAMFVPIGEAKKEG